tara:strand:+ start:13933 stop:14643 length:711 start_codon:yes stop_codon:yes gene_type:complete
MELSDLTINLFELMAALSSSYYWVRTKDFRIKPIVWLLWLTVFVETFGLYGYVLQNNYCYDWFLWVKNSVFCRNRWLYNILSLLSVILLGLFFRNHLHDKISKKIVVIIFVLSSVFSIAYFSITNGFFTKSIPYDALIQTLTVFVFVMLYFKELLKSDEILKFYKSYLFYISLGLLLWYLCITPLVIFDAYFYDVNPSFIEFRGIYLLIANILLYSCYTFAFIYSLHHNEKLVQKK